VRHLWTLKSVDFHRDCGLQSNFCAVVYSLEAANKVLGDLLCLAGAVLYGVSNVCQEYLVCHFGSLQYLAAIGLFGSITSGIQL